MAQPGLGRAFWFGIFGFLTGALLVTFIRAMQQMNPVWDSGVGIIFGMFISAFFFVWGIGGFNFRLSAHGEGPEIEAIHRELEAEAQQPRSILSGIIWQMAGLLLLFLLITFAFAIIPGGVALTTTAIPDASVAQNGFIELSIFGQTVLMGQLTLLILFIAFMLLTLAAIGGGLAFLVFRYDNTLKLTLTEEAAGAGPALASGAAAAALPAPQGDIVSVPAQQQTTAPAPKPLTIPLPKWLEYLIVFGSLLYVANFPLMALTNANVPLASIWGLLWTLFVLASLVLFIEIVPTHARPIDAVVKYALTGIAAYVVIGLVAGTIATQLQMVIDPFFAAVFLIIGIVMSLAAPALVFRADGRMAVLARYTVTFLILYAVFYYVAIGLIIPAEPAKTVLSVANALLFVAVIWRLPWLLGLVGMGAALLARFLRWLPKVLFQRG
jgi:hypothetical protein